MPFRWMIGTAMLAAEMKRMHLPLPEDLHVRLERMTVAFLKQGGE